MAVGVEWMDRANCVGTDTAAFFPEKAKDARDMNSLAMRTCNNCEVRVECLRYAVEHSLDHGIFGGMLPHERRMVTLRAVS